MTIRSRQLAIGCHASIWFIQFRNNVKNFILDPDAGPPVIPLTDPDAPDPNAPPQSEDSASTTRYIYEIYVHYIFL